MFASAIASSQDFMEVSLEGKKAADFTLETLDAGKVNFNQYRHGQKAIIFFWATWCPHCRRQLTELNNLHAQLEEKNIKVALVDIQEDAETVRAHLGNRQISMNVFLDKNAQIAEQYQLIGVPTLFFVDEKGIIKNSEHEISVLWKNVLSQTNAEAGK